MPNPILPRRSFTANSVPLTTDAQVGELLINWADGKLFTKNSAGQIVSHTLGGSGGGGGGTTEIVYGANVVDFPATGATANLYIATETQKIYRWNSTASAYVEVGPLAGGVDLSPFFLPPAPTGLTATAGAAQVMLSWTAPSVLAQTPITDYLVQFKTASASTWETFADGTSTTTSATVTGLTNGTAYVFRVAAVNGVGTGAYTAASSSVTPVNIPFSTNSSLRAWLDASSANSLYDSTSGGSVVTSGNAVARWQDLSGNGNHFIQSSSGNRPTFDGTGVQMAENTSRWLSLAYSQNSNALSFFAVATLDARNSGQNRYGRYFSAAGGYYGNPDDYSNTNGLLFMDETSTTQFYRQSQTVASRSAASLGTRNVVGFVLNGGNVTVYQNLNTASGTTSTTPINLVEVRIGSNGSTDSALAGRFYEVVMFNSAVSSQLATDTVSYLMTKWGIT